MSQPLGTINWIDLGTTDAESAMRFYQGLFGWEFEDLGEEMGHYHFIRSGGALVGGFMDIAGMTYADGRPVGTSWDVFLSTPDIDRTWADAVANGADPVIPPSDSGEMGRNASFRDPSGAAVGLWEPGTVAGLEDTGDVGTSAWYELMTRDYDATSAFYTAVVDFRPVLMGEGEQQVRYATNGEGEHARWGMCDVGGMEPADAGSYWRVYFRVADTDAAVEQVARLGGELLDGPIDSPFGRVATVADPMGASFQLIAANRPAGR